MSDLVKRLRKLYEQGYPPVSALEEAADRIEALEKALARIAYYDDTLDRHTAIAMQNTARQALLTRAALKD